MFICCAHSRDELVDTRVDAHHYGAWRDVLWHPDAHPLRLDHLIIAFAVTIARGRDGEGGFAIPTKKMMGGDCEWMASHAK